MKNKYAITSVAAAAFVGTAVSASACYWVVNNNDAQHYECFVSNAPCAGGFGWLYHDTHYCSDMFLSFDGPYLDCSMSNEVIGSDWTCSENSETGKCEKGQAVDAFGYTASPSGIGSCTC